MLKRTLFLTNPYLTGADVKEVQHLLGVYADGQYGPETADAAYWRKFTLGYMDVELNRRCGPRLYGFLTGRLKQNKAMIELAAKRKKVGASITGMRLKIVEFCEYGISHEPGWHYAQIRPMEGLRDPRTLLAPIRSLDCSEFTTDAYAWAGAPDPNGLNFDGDGYTGTLLGHCRPITRSMLLPGDPIVFGPGTGHHVVVALEHGYDPECASHGMERGPLRIKLSAEASFQPEPIRCLRLPGW